MNNELENKINEQLPALEGIIIGLNDQAAAIRVQTGQEINWPISFLPDGIGENDRVWLRAYSSPNAAIEHEKIAKAILKEILKDDED